MMMQQWTIYIAETPDGKRYVGKTKGSEKKSDSGLARRIAAHYREAKIDDSLFHQQLNKFGEKIKFRILETVYTHADAAEREKYWMRTLKTLHTLEQPNGLNSTDRSTGGTPAKRQKTRHLQMTATQRALIAAKGRWRGIQAHREKRN